METRSLGSPLPFEALPTPAGSARQTRRFPLRHRRGHSRASRSCSSPPSHTGATTFLCSRAESCPPQCELEATRVPRARCAFGGFGSTWWPPGPGTGPALSTRPPLPATPSSARSSRGGTRRCGLSRKGNSAAPPHCSEGPPSTCHAPPLPRAAQGRRHSGWLCCYYYYYYLYCYYHYHHYYYYYYYYHHHHCNHSAGSFAAQRQRRRPSLSRALARAAPEALW
mmetsp:Transcript_70938/g.139391  ORF Transcript_70938/g.139391 Transcript_70938/m.139391 type:complete len:224 (-) Transcript_70938:119-790(-)